MTYTPDPGEIRANEEMLQREREEAKRVAELKEQQKILDQIDLERRNREGNDIYQEDLLNQNDDEWEEDPNVSDVNLFASGGKYAMVGLQKFGEGIDWVGDKVIGIPGTDIDLYHARRKLIDPLTEQHVALGLLGEIFIPDAMDIATAGLSYIPRRFLKAGKLLEWAKLVRKPEGAAGLRGLGRIEDVATRSAKGEELVPITAISRDPIDDNLFRGDPRRGIPAGYTTKEELYAAIDGGWKNRLMKDSRVGEKYYYKHISNKVDPNTGRRTFNWEGEKIVNQPLAVGDGIRIADGSLLYKDRLIDLSKWDWKDPDSFEKFEDALHDYFRMDEIGLDFVKHAGKKRSDVITAAITGKPTKGVGKVKPDDWEQGVGKLWNDYLDAYFEKFIRAGQADSFMNAVRIKLPSGGILRGDEALLRRLRLRVMHPPAFGDKGAFRAGSRSYEAAKTKLIHDYTWGGVSKVPNEKIHAHHVNIISESWPLFQGLPDSEIAEMHRLLNHYSKWMGDTEKNRMMMFDAFHSKMHNDVLTPYFAEWKLRMRSIVTDPNYATAKSRMSFIRNGTAGRKGNGYVDLMDIAMNDINSSMAKVIEQRNIDALVSQGKIINDEAYELWAEFQANLIQKRTKPRSAYDEVFADRFGWVDEMNQEDIDFAFGRMQDR